MSTLLQCFQPTGRCRCVIRGIRRGMCHRMLSESTNQKISTLTDSIRVIAICKKRDGAPWYAFRVLLVCNQDTPTC